MLKKNLHLWLPSYLWQSVKYNSQSVKNGTTHIMFCLVDHFEPQWNRPTYEVEVKRVNAWFENYPRLADGHCDADGRCPQHTWFYPQEEYRAEHLEKLSQLCGFGEIELHLHHDNDTPSGLQEKIEQAKQLFAQHGALITSQQPPKFAYGFIHGNWSLDNSRKDRRWCGVNNELQILQETGCYADFTLPSAPSDTQTRKINSLYYAKDDPHKPKSHNTGIDVEVGGKPTGDLMLIQGPLCLNWKQRRKGVFPAIENGSVTATNPPTKDRIDLWVQQHIHVKGRPDWVFVKVYTHGAQDDNRAAFFGAKGYLDRMYSYLEQQYNDGKFYKLHYVTAREMYNIIKAAEAGKNGNPNPYRDYLIPPYLNRGGDGVLSLNA